MSWLEKMGLVEKKEPIIPVTVDDIPEPEECMEVEINSATNIVDEIYEQNGISSNDNSIYTVQALIGTLPPEMTTQRKQKTVAGILKVSGKSVETLMDDAQNRVNLLCSARDRIVADKNNEIATANDDIEELKKAIEFATIKIREAEDIIDATDKSVNTEIDNLDDLIKFCEGMMEEEA